MTYYEIIKRKGIEQSEHKMYPHGAYVTFAKAVHKLQKEGLVITSTEVLIDGLKVYMRTPLPPHTPPTPSAEPRCRKCNALMRDDQLVCSCGWDMAEYGEYLRKKNREDGY